MAEIQHRDGLSQEPPRLFMPLPWDRLSTPARAAGAVFSLAFLMVVGYFAATAHPDTAPPRGSDAEREIAAVFGLPLESRDDIVSGDLLVERFYAVDMETGEHFVADILKGRVQRVLESQNENGNVQYTLLLDLANLQRDRALLAAYVGEVAQPQVESGFYLGLRLPVGLTEAFRLNFDGLLPPERFEFRGPHDQDIYTFLTQQNFAEVTQAPRIIGVGGYNYLLSNTELYPYFRSEFRLPKAVFMSELVLVDMTGREQAATYYRLLQHYPRTSP
jgi:hypothetical protein